MRRIDDLIPYKSIPVICGPTASGKSAVANELCLMTGGELVSADSMQIYRTLDVGTAKPSKSEQELIPHHLIDIADPGTSFSVRDYSAALCETLDGILSRGKLPVICGGTGQYISMIRDGIRYVDETVDDEITDSLYERYDNGGADELYDELLKTDPEAAAKIHPNNKRRLVRALAVCIATGRTFTEWNNGSKTEGPRYPYMLFAPDYEEHRDILYDRINRRVEIMMKEGLADEARALYSSDAARPSTCFQAIGYKEFEGCFDDPPVKTLERAEYEIKLNTRHYAKRQLTWFRYMDGIIPLPYDADPVSNAEKILGLIRN